MKIIFICNGVENLGVEYLSSTLEQDGFKTVLAFDPALFNKQYVNQPTLARFFDIRKNIIDKVISEKPDLVAVSTVTDNYLWACDLAKEIKKKMTVPIIFGGIHVTSVPEVVINNDFVDMICIGEGEAALLELVRSLAEGEINYSIKNIWFKKNGAIVRNPIRELTDNLDWLPFPNKSLFENETNIKNGFYTAITTRGCPYRCTYCCNNVFSHLYKRNLLRRRSVKNVISELKQMKDKYGYKMVLFQDDSFTINGQWVKEFCEIYKKEIGVPFECTTHPLLVNDELAKNLKSAGCLRVKFGVQHLDPYIKRDVLKRPETQEDIQKALNSCHKCNLSYSLDTILGLPFDIEEKQKKVAEFYVDTNAKRISTFWLEYFPKTEIIDIAKENNMINDSEIADLEQGRGKDYYSSGSISKDKVNVYKNFQNFYCLLPLLNKKVRKFILKKNIYKYFWAIPSPIIFLVDVVTSIVTKHPTAFMSMAFYRLHIFKILKIKITGKKRATESVV